MTNMTIGRATPRPLARLVRGENPFWRMDGLVRAFPSGFAFSRGSGGGYFDHNGLWVMAGSDEPRFDHHPLTGAPRGLLLEGQRTNLLLWNRDLTNAAWTKTNMTIAKNAVGIDGVSASASTLTAGANNAIVLQAVTSGSAARSVAAYVRRVSGSGTVEMTQNGGSTWTAVAVTGSWSRVGPASATVTNPSVGFRLAASGDVIEVDYVQLENGVFSSSAIATTFAQVTRAGDLPVCAELKAIGYNVAEGTFLTEFEPVGINSGDIQRLFTFDDGGTNTVVGLGMRASGSNLQPRISNGGATTYNSVGGTIVAGQANRAVMAWKNQDALCCLNGSLLVANTSAVIPSGLGWLRLGHGAGGSVPGFFWLRRMEYHPVRLANGQLQTLATV